MKMNRHSLTQDVSQVVRNTFARIELTEPEKEDLFNLCQSTPKGSLLFGEMYDIYEFSRVQFRQVLGKYDFLELLLPTEGREAWEFWFHEAGYYIITLAFDVISTGGNKIDCGELYWMSPEPLIQDIYAGAHIKFTGIRHFDGGELVTFVPIYTGGLFLVTENAYLKVWKAFEG